MRHPSKKYQHFTDRWQLFVLELFLIRRLLIFCTPPSLTFRRMGCQWPSVLGWSGTFSVDRFCVGSKYFWIVWSDFKILKDILSRLKFQLGHIGTVSLLRATQLGAPKMVQIGFITLNPKMWRHLGEANMRLWGKRWLKYMLISFHAFHASFVRKQGSGVCVVFGFQRMEIWHPSEKINVYTVYIIHWFHVTMRYIYIYTKNACQHPVIHGI